MRVALYARVSSDAQDSELSISAQLRTMHDYAAKQKHLVIEEFVDEAKSGRTSDRPEFLRMVSFARMEHRPIDAILVWKFNRFARDRHVSVTYKHLLKKSGVDVISINEPVDDSPAGQMLSGIIEAVDEFYSANLGQDISRGMKEAATQGYFVASTAPYGYRRSKILTDSKRIRYTLTPVASESQRVLTIFNRLSQGIGLKNLAKEINSHGFLTRSGKRWTSTGLHKLATNEAYTGTLVWGAHKNRKKLKNHEEPDPVRVQNAWPKIVSKQLFNKVNAALASRRKERFHSRFSGSSYMLTGLVYCGHCGLSMTGHSAKSGRFHYYLCSTRNKQGSTSCKQSMINRERMDSALVARTRTRLLSDHNLERLMRAVNKELKQRKVSDKTRTDKITHELSDVNQRLDRYYDAFERGDVAASDVNQRVQTLSDKNAQLENERHSISDNVGNQRISLDTVRQHVKNLRRLLAIGDQQTRKSVFRSFVDRIDVQDDEVTVSYRLPENKNAAPDEETAVLTLILSGGAERMRSVYGSVDPVTDF